MRKLIKLGKYAFFLYNDWPEGFDSRDKFYLIKAGREWRNGGWIYEISLIGFALTWFNRNK
jgi:hypothetical protein